jgi:DNA-directed RNA polymerase subunit RPC12/RpoP
MDVEYSVKRTIRCAKCHKAFEVVGNQGSQTQTRDESVTCPYCSEPTEVKWPKNQTFFIRKIPSEM